MATMKLDDNSVYNKWDNVVMVKTDGDKILVICSKEEQTDVVVTRLTTPRCKLVGFEEWDEGEDKKWLLTFYIVSDEFEIQPELN